MKETRATGVGSGYGMERDRLNIFDMLDALETGISRLHTPNGKSRTIASPLRGDSVRAGALRAQMEKSGLSSIEFTSIFGVQPAMFEGWLRGSEAIPSWVPASIRILAMVSPAERRKLRSCWPWPTDDNPARSHPFSRIEEL